jgi:OOP family OmpA-OmpF porin
MKKIILLLAVFFAVTFAAQSQNKMRPWLVGASTNYVDFLAVPMPVSEQLTNANWMGNTVLSQIKVARLLSKEIVFSTEFSMIKLEKEKLNAWTGGEYQPAISNNNMWRIQGQFAYKFANGYLLKDDAMFDPYVFLGANATIIDETAYLAQSTGVGLNIWVTDWLGVNVEGSYDWVIEWNDYFHYSAGVVVRFGKKNDVDKDGISDKKDLCPNTAGLAEFKGCPDTDGDGVPDKEDKCPTVAGPKVLNGCPDTDGDGVIDTEDRCPTVAGPKITDGCPDADGDGVFDDNDKCPNVAGLAQFGGCPDSDGDGIADYEDQCPAMAGPESAKGCPDADFDGIPDVSDACPNEKGTIENKGCPTMKMSEVKVKEVESQLNSFSDYVEFETNKYVIKQKSFANLNEIVTLMQQYPDAKFAIEGHTDDVGQDADNQVLSESRAYAMYQYFVDKGIDPKRMTFVGFGESRPRDTNATPEGRAKNRRVEIRLVQ